MPRAAFSLHGSAIGRGVAIGRARVLQAHGHDIDRYQVEEVQVEAEVARLSAAVAEVRGELTQLAAELPAAAPAEARALLDVHVLLLDDPMFSGRAEALVREERRNAEWAVWTQAEDLSDQFEALDDDYLRERGRDVRQVADRVLRVLSGNARPRGPSEGNDAIVLVADDIAPADLLHWRGIQGLCIDQGGVVSHSAILARSLGRPAVIGLGRASELVRDGDLVVIDGDHGALLVCPDADTLAAYLTRRDRDQAALSSVRKRLAGLPSRTRDGVDVTLQANIELPGEAAAAREAGAEGVGLMRSEFLFLGRERLPDEEEQYAAYRDVVLAMEGRPVTIRTIDVGADKALPSGHPPSDNPALGERAIRFCLSHPRLFLVQLRAILRAASHGPVRLLLPLVSTDAEVVAVRRLLETAQAQLAAEGRPVAGKVPLGAMIEVPAAAIMAPWFARRLDFLSVGTNDLIQYTLAIDRTDDAVASLYDPLHPAVLRLIAHTLAAGRRAGIPVSVCGEMAGDPALAPLLLGLGLRDFSMNPSQLLPVKEAVLAADAGAARREARRALTGFAERA